MNIAMADSLMAVFGFKRVKGRKCKVCKSSFLPTRPLQAVCGIECAKQHAHNTTAKKARQEASAKRKEIRDQRERLKTRQQWLREAQTAFNAYIRARDSALPCVSCGRHHRGDNHAGHYRSVGAAPQLRFNELNVWLQCQPCNTHKSGNAIEYRISLVRRIGLHAVEALENNNEIRKWTIEDAKQIKSHYRQKLRALMAQNTPTP